MLRVHCAVPEVRFPLLTRRGDRSGGTGYLHRVSATIARGKRPVPSRTRKLSLSAPMVLRGPLRGRVGRRRTHFRPRSFGSAERPWLFFFEPVPFRQCRNG